MVRRGAWLLGVAATWPVMALAAAGPSSGDQGLADEGWAAHAQATFIEQFHPGFASPYRGPNSLDPGRRGDETTTLTLFGGLRLWQGAEVWINPEVDQGFGLSNSAGIAGFPSGGAYKLGQATPYILLQRLFLRQTIDLGGARQAVDPGPNQLGGHETADRLVLTAGKLAITDIFDTNRYAHDSDNDFLNWSVIDSGAFDYVANAFGYTYGVTGEWYRDWWTVRGGVFDGSAAPNTRALSTPLGKQTQAVVEAEARTRFFGQAGAIRLLAFATHANLARLSALDRLLREDPGASRAQQVALRGPAAKYGAALNIEQAINEHIGLFLRASLGDGRTETYDFTDIDRSVATGASGDGARWNRPNDRWGTAFVVNTIDHARKVFLAAGGLGLLVGDGRLPRAGPEQISESCYSVTLPEHLVLTADYQLVNHPAYNRARGPVNVFGLRLHVVF